jgi:hypothetical protein
VALSTRKATCITLAVTWNAARSARASLFRVDVGLINMTPEQKWEWGFYFFIAAVDLICIWQDMVKELTYINTSLLLLWLAPRSVYGGKKK